MIIAEMRYRRVIPLAELGWWSVGVAVAAALAAIWYNARKRKRKMEKRQWTIFTEAAMKW